MSDRLLTVVLDRGALVEAEGAEVAVPWWSFGKTMIAAAALRLVEDGAFALDAPMACEACTLLQLLQHS